MILLCIDGTWYAHPGPEWKVPTDALQYAKVIIEVDTTEAKLLKDQYGNQGIAPLADCALIKPAKAAG